MNRSFALVGLTIVMATGCSLALDFDDPTNLPCPCDEQHVCDVGADRCVLRGSVDDYKACETNTEPPGGDALCKGTAICTTVNDQGPRCLPTCRPKSYALTEASVAIATECRQTGTTCFPVAQGGVCSQGLCDTSPTSCGPGAECQVFNGAGLCFTVCDFYKRNEDPCGGGQVCHPIGNSQTTACIEPGTRARNEICDLENLCLAKDLADRTLICTRPMGSSNDQPRCLPSCIPGAGGCGGSCVQAANGTDRISMLPVFICENEP